MPAVVILWVVLGRLPVASPRPALSVPEGDTIGYVLSPYMWTAFVILMAGVFAEVARRGVGEIVNRLDSNMEGLECES